ncbi:hypothetical protein SNEBB_005500 [Seison nebaliae]|nr:hypothetical protein SNEBB_005500 [Seison nebaliae]
MSNLVLEEDVTWKQILDNDKIIRHLTVIDRMNLIISLDGAHIKDRLLSFMQTSLSICPIRLLLYCGFDGILANQFFYCAETLLMNNRMMKNNMFNDSNLLHESYYQTIWSYIMKMIESFVDWPSLNFQQDINKIPLSGKLNKFLLYSMTRMMRNSKMNELIWPSDNPFKTELTNYYHIRNVIYHFYSIMTNPKLNKSLVNNGNIGKILKDPNMSPHLSLLDRAAELIKHSKKIVVVTGAGISVSCGIPDFRSKDTGLYPQLRGMFPELERPEDIFSIDFFLFNPKPFYQFALQMFPGKFHPSLTHHFIKRLETKKKLLMNYTQNIDTLEQMVGLKCVVECHGSFENATCVTCKFKIPTTEIKEEIYAQQIPYCPRCRKRDDFVTLEDQNLFSQLNSASDVDEIFSRFLLNNPVFDTSKSKKKNKNQIDCDQVSSTSDDVMKHSDTEDTLDLINSLVDLKSSPVHEMKVVNGDDIEIPEDNSKRKINHRENGKLSNVVNNLNDDSDDNDDEKMIKENSYDDSSDEESLNLSKTDLNSLLLNQAKFIMKPDITFFGEQLSQTFHSLLPSHLRETDLLIVIGSSLIVQPVARIPSLLNRKIPRILINRQRLRHLPKFDVELIGSCDEIVQQICRSLQLQTKEEKWNLPISIDELIHYPKRHLREVEPIKLINPIVLLGQILLNLKLDVDISYMKIFEKFLKNSYISVLNSQSDFTIHVKWANDLNEMMENNSNFRQLLLYGKYVDKREWKKSVDLYILKNSCIVIDRSCLIVTNNAEIQFGELIPQWMEVYKGELFEKLKKKQISKKIRKKILSMKKKKNKKVKEKRKIIKHSMKKSALKRKLKLSDRIKNMKKSNKISRKF